MNKKKLTTGLVALALVGVVGVGGSLAWFTDRETKENSFTTNHVNIGLDYSASNIDGFVPGDKIDIVSKVKVAEDSSTAFVRIKNLTLNVKLADGSEKNIQLDEAGRNELGIQLGDNWAQDNGDFYYMSSLKQNETTTSLIDSITVPTSWGNAFANAELALTMEAEAVQTANTGDDAIEAFATATSNGGLIEDYDLVQPLTE